MEFIECGKLGLSTYNITTICTTECQIISVILLDKHYIDDYTEILFVYNHKVYKGIGKYSKENNDILYAITGIFDIFQMYKFLKFLIK